MRTPYFPSATTRSTCWNRFGARAPNLPNEPGSDDVFGRHLLAVVEEHSFAQLDDDELAPSRTSALLAK